MKKVLVICLMMVLVASMSVNVFAAPNAFVSSPSGNLAPELIEGTNEDEDCTADVFITSFADRDELPEEAREQIEKAYEEIAAATDLTAISSDLEALASQQGVKLDNLSVSDLFNVNHKDCDDHEDHGHFDITLKAETLNRFVGLLCFSNGKWELIKNAKIEIVNGEPHLKFSVQGASSFAIVVNNADNQQGVSPETGDNSRMHIYMIAMAASALAMVLVGVKAKKQTA